MHSQHMMEPENMQPADERGRNTPCNRQRPLHTHGDTALQMHLQRLKPRTTLEQHTTTSRQASLRKSVNSSSHLQLHCKYADVFASLLVAD